MVKISIIIVTYNSRDLIIDCLLSLYKFNDLNKNEIEIIIVDNSNETEHLLLRKLIFDNFNTDPIIIHNPKNGGYGQGNNLGVSIAKGNVICIMNPDVRLLEPLFVPTLKHFENNKIASVGYKQITGGLDFSFFQRPEFFVPFYSSIKVRHLNNKDVFHEKKYYLSGAFVFFRKSDFEVIGKYDERMFMYFEEPDMAKRINNIGKISIFDSSKKYLHLMEQKDDYNDWLLDVGATSLGIYYSKFNLNLQRHLKLIYIENYLFILIFSIIGKKSRVEKSRAVIKSLKKLKS
ncbi:MULTISPECIES: glycosyltransferase [Empedobacter]|uniref:glycosyltransferase n=1 Tax=Empedobacter TaxID=59734 RepID=UPI0005705560|nr:MULTISPECIES: glycosyltransferase [Empedobacter]